MRVVERTHQPTSRRPIRLPSRATHHHRPVRTESVVLRLDRHLVSRRTPGSLQPLPVLLLGSLHRRLRRTSRSPSPYPSSLVLSLNHSFAVAMPEVMNRVRFPRWLVGRTLKTLRKKPLPGSGSRHDQVSEGRGKPVQVIDASPSSRYAMCLAVVLLGCPVIRVGIYA